jgi:hypothetical protein
MGKIELPKPVKLINGILSSMPELFPEAERCLLEKFGDIDHKTGLIPFTFTDYYNKTMGQPILRQFLSFSKLIEPDELPGIKIWTNKLEDKLAHAKRHSKIPRPINLDPGYLDQAKLLLASTKDYSHRIYLSKGIYAEVTLYYQDGSYQSWPWTYPDYKTKEYAEFLQTARNAYQKQLKS